MEETLINIVSDYEKNKVSIIDKETGDVLISNTPVKVVGHLTNSIAELVIKTEELEEELFRLRTALTERICQADTLFERNKELQVENDFYRKEEQRRRDIAFIGNGRFA